MLTRRTSITEDMKKSAGTSPMNEPAKVDLSKLKDQMPQGQRRLSLQDEESVKRQFQKLQSMDEYSFIHT